MADQRKKKRAVASTTAGAIGGSAIAKRTSFGRKAASEFQEQAAKFNAIPYGRDFADVSKAQRNVALKKYGKYAAISAGGMVAGGALGYGAYKGASKLYSKSPKAQALVANQKKKSAARKEKRRVKRIVRQTDKPGVEWNSLRGRQNALKARDKASFSAERQIEKARRLQQPYDDYKFDQSMDSLAGRETKPLQGIHGAFVMGSSVIGKEMERQARTGIDAAYIRAQRRNSRYTNDKAGWRAQARDDGILASDMSNKLRQAKNKQDVQNFKRGVKRTAKTARKKISSPYYYRTVKGKRQRVRKGKRR